MSAAWRGAVAPDTGENEPLTLNFLWNQSGNSDFHVLSHFEIFDIYSLVAWVKLRTYQTVCRYPDHESPLLPPCLQSVTRHADGGRGIGERPGQGAHRRVTRHTGSGVHPHGALRPAGNDPGRLVRNGAAMGGQRTGGGGPERGRQPARRGPDRERAAAGQYHPAVHRRRVRQRLHPVRRPQGRHHPEQFAVDRGYPAGGVRQRQPEPAAGRLGPHHRQPGHRHTAEPVARLPGGCRTRATSPPACWYPSRT